MNNEMEMKKQTNENGRPSAGGQCNVTYRVKFRSAEDKLYLADEMLHERSLLKRQINNVAALMDAYFPEEGKTFSRERYLDVLTRLAITGAVVEEFPKVICVSDELELFTSAQRTPDRFHQLMLETYTAVGMILRAFDMEDEAVALYAISLALQMLFNAIDPYDESIGVYDEKRFYKLDEVELGPTAEEKMAEKGGEE